MIRTGEVVKVEPLGNGAGWTITVGHEGGPALAVLGDECPGGPPAVGDVVRFRAPEFAGVVARRGANP